MSENMSIDNKRIDKFYSLIDKACLVYYNDIGMDYIEAYTKVAKDITLEFDEGKLSQKAIDRLNKIYGEIEELEILNEEVRLAVEMIIVKGLKHRNVLLDFMTPDVINYLYAHIIKSIIYHSKLNKEKEIVIMDTVLGTGNLLHTIINNINDVEVKGVGIEHDELLVHVAKATTELLGNEVVINYNDALEDDLSYANIVIGDFGESADLYKIIEKRIDNLTPDGYFVYVINNDFFSKIPSDFKEIVTSQATLVGLIVLPSNFTNAEHVGKSILIGKRQVLKDYQMAVIKMNDELSQDNLEEAFEKINNMFTNLEEK